MPLADLEALGYTVEPNAGVGGQTLIYGPEDVEPFTNIWLVDDEDAQAVQDLVDKANNHAAVLSKLANVQQLFADNYANWPTMTNAQKDQANRNAQRAIANLIRNVRKDMTEEGV